MTATDYSILDDLADDPGVINARKMAAIPPTPDNLTALGRMLADLDRATRAHATTRRYPTCGVWTCAKKWQRVPRKCRTGEAA